MVTSSPGLSGIGSMALLSLPACVVKSSPPLTVTASLPTLVTMGGDIALSSTRDCAKHTNPVVDNNVDVIIDSCWLV